MANISDFKSQLTKGGFRPNQFKCNILFPAGVAGGALAGQKTQFLAKAAQLPASTISSVPVSYRGRPVKFAGEREFAPWTIEVYTDTDFVVRNAFEAWVNLMQKSSSTGGSLLPATYKADLSAIALDRNDREVKVYNFIGAFPVDISAIQLDWEQNNQIATFQVTMDYDYFDSV